MFNARVEYEFLKRLRTSLTWAEIAYGFKRQLIGSSAVIDYALDRIAAVDEPSDDEIAIASSSVNDSIIEQLHRLAKGAEGDAEAFQLRWAQLLLAWVYERRDQFDDPLGIVEEIYSEFGYPEEFAPFVRYMPSDAPDLGSVEANEERMLASIGEHVDCLFASD